MFRLVLASRKCIEIVSSAQLILLMIALLISASSQVLLANDPEKTPRDKAQQGLQLFSSGKFAEAAEAFEQAAQQVAVDTADGSVLKFNQACALRAAGELSRAKTLLQDVANGENHRLASAAQFNLALIATDEAKQLLGDDPANLEAKDRSPIIELLKSSQSHYRDSLRADEENADARHNLELLRLFIEDLEKGWRESDLRKQRESKNLFEYLAFLDQQVHQVSDATASLNRRKTMVSRLERTRLGESQSKLLDEFEPLKGKIAAAIQSSFNATQNGNAIEGPAPQIELSADEQARVQEIQGILSEFVDRSRQSISRAADSIQGGEFSEAIQFQNSARDQLNELFQGIAPFQELLMRTIADQEQLLKLNEQSTNATSAGSSHVTDFAQQAWKQNWISQFSTALSPRASAMLQSLPPSGSSEGLRLDSKQGDPQNSKPQEELGSVLASENAKEPDVPSENDANSAAGSDAAANSSDSSDQDAANALRRALEKAIETSPEIEKHSKSASDNLIREEISLAAAEQREVLRLLREIADLLPKQPPKEQPQDQQHSDQQNSDQQRDNNPTDDKQQQEKQQQEKQEQDKQQQDSQEKSQQPQEKPSPNAGDKPKESDSNDREDSESSEQKQPRQTKPDKPSPKESQEKTDSDKEPSNDKSDDLSKEPKNEKQPSIANQDKDRDQRKEQSQQRKLAEERAQSILRKIREREAKYRELLEQLREIQARQLPVEKDW